MNREDALLYFPIDENTDIDELYEDLLFEQKQFLSNRAPISKVFDSRINRLKKIHEAYLFFGGEQHEVPQYESSSLKTSTSAEIRTSFRIFEENLNRIKLEIYRAQYVTELINAIHLLFENQRTLAEKCSKVENEIDLNTIISKEPDSMEIIKAIEDAEKNGIREFHQLSQLPDDNMLKQEAIRLSLWLKFETNV